MEMSKNIKKVGHVTLATPPLGSFLIHYVVRAMVDLTKKTRSLKLQPFKSYGGRSLKI